MLFFNGLWSFVIKITSGFREALKRCVVDQCTQQAKFTTIPWLRRSNIHHLYWKLALNFIFQNVTCHMETWQTMQRNEVNWNMQLKHANIWKMFPKWFSNGFQCFQVPLDNTANALKCIGNAWKCIPMFLNALWTKTGLTLFPLSLVFPNRY